MGVCRPINVLVYAAIWAIYFEGARGKTNFGPPVVTEDILRLYGKDDDGMLFRCLEARCPESVGACAGYAPCAKLLAASPKLMGCRTEMSHICEEFYGNASGCPPDVEQFALPVWNCYAGGCVTHWVDELPAVVKYTARLNAAERDTIRALRNTLLPKRGKTFRKFGKTAREGQTHLGHNVTFLNAEFVRQRPAIYKRLRGLAEKADLEAGWGQFENKKAPLHMRVVEFLEYVADENSQAPRGASLDIAPPTKYGEGSTAALGWHTDVGSRVTLVAMLSNSDDYDGGVLQTERACDVTSHSMDIGDVRVYRALQQHRVLPVTRGTRHVLVIEWWPHPFSGTNRRLAADIGRDGLVEAWTSDDETADLDPSPEAMEALAALGLGKGGSVSHSEL